MSIPDRHQTKPCSIQTRGHSHNEHHSQYHSQFVAVQQPAASILGSPPAADTRQHTPDMLRNHSAHERNDNQGSLVLHDHSYCNYFFHLFFVVFNKKCNCMQKCKNTKVIHVLFPSASPTNILASA